MNLHLSCGMWMLALLLWACPAAAQATAPAPAHRDIAYAQTGPEFGQGHLLDLYLPAARSGPVPVVVFTRGSGWLADNGRENAQDLAAVLGPEGYAVAGVAVRSSDQTQFPGQLHDIKAAIRWLRRHGHEYGIDSERIGIVGTSSGGWVAVMAAVTGDVPELEGQEGESGVSSAVQAAIAFYPPTDFSSMDAWAVRRCDPDAEPLASARSNFCHSSAGSPESRLLGCTVAECPERAAAASPLRYLSAADPPIMIIHGEHDAIVPHQQGEWLYQALNKACLDAVFISLPLAGHGNWDQIMTDPAFAYGATIRSTSQQGCKVELPRPYVPDWRTLIEFLQRALQPGA